MTQKSVSVGPSLFLLHVWQCVRVLLTCLLSLGFLNREFKVRIRDVFGVHVPEQG